MPTRSYKERDEIKRKILEYMKVSEAAPKTWKELRTKARNDRISPTTLSRYLKLFERANIINREVNAIHRPPRTLYRLATHPLPPLPKLSEKESKIVFSRLSEYPKEVANLDPVFEGPITPYPLDWFFMIGIIAVWEIFMSVRHHSDINEAREEIRNKFTFLAEHPSVGYMTEMIFTAFGAPPDHLERARDIYEKAFAALIAQILNDAFKIPINLFPWQEFPAEAQIGELSALSSLRPVTFDPRSKKNQNELSTKSKEWHKFLADSIKKYVTSPTSGKSEEKGIEP